MGAATERSFDNRDTYLQSPRDPTSPVIYVPFAPPESFTTMRFCCTISTFHVLCCSETQLHAKIVSNIEYYFSYENLVNNTYLRKTMDEEGWVSASLKANFKKMSIYGLIKSLRDNAQLILDAMQTSSVVKVQIICDLYMYTAAGQYSNPSSPQAVGRSSPTDDGLVSQLQGVALNDTTSTIN